MKNYLKYSLKQLKVYNFNHISRSNIKDQPKLEETYLNSKKYKKIT